MGINETHLLPQARNEKVSPHRFRHDEQAGVYFVTHALFRRKNLQHPLLKCLLWLDETEVGVTWLLCFCDGGAECDGPSRAQK